jgi:hypothetical protein
MAAGPPASRASGGIRLRNQIVSSSWGTRGIRRPRCPEHARARDSRSCSGWPEQHENRDGTNSQRAHRRAPPVQCLRQARTRGQGGSCRGGGYLRAGSDIGYRERRFSAALISIEGLIRHYMFRLILRHPPALLLAMICLIIAMRARALIGSPRRMATVRAVVLSWPPVMIPSGSGTIAPS